jgi:hypothetical protein
VALRPSLLGVPALVLALAGCGGGGSSAPAAPPSPHQAESAVVDLARGSTGGDDLQLAWVKALRIASGPELSQFKLDATDARADDWYLVQGCSFGGGNRGYWANPVAHRVVGVDAGDASLVGGSHCDVNAAFPPPAKATGDECMDSWNAWIAHAPIAFRAAAAAARHAFAGKLDNRCIVVLQQGDEGVTLMEGAGESWSIFDTTATPADPNAVVHADGTLARA